MEIMNYPHELLTVLIEPITNPMGSIGYLEHISGTVRGFIIYFPIAGIFDEEQQRYCHLEYVRGAIVTDNERPDDEVILLKESKKLYSVYFALKYVTSQKCFLIENNNLSGKFKKFYEQMENNIGHLCSMIGINSHKIFYESEEEISNNIEKSQMSYVRFMSNRDITPSQDIQQQTQTQTQTSSNETTSNSAQNTTITVNKSLWDYPGFKNEAPLQPSPWEAFASHIESEEDGGFCKGQWDGHFNKNLIGTYACGIVPGNGNRQKIEDIIKENIIDNNNPLYTLFMNLLKAKNSRERIKFVKDYLDEKNQTYDDPSFLVVATNQRQSFFKYVIFPYIQQTMLFKRNINKKKTIITANPN